MEKELIKVTKKDDGTVAVLARELYEFLELKTPYSQWFYRMLTYGFTENVDFIGFSQKSEKGGRPKKEFIISLDMAKEVAMLQRNKKGKEAREYFIAIEKKYKQLPQQQSQDSYMIADPVERAKKWIEEQTQHKQELAQKENKIKELQPAADYTNNVLQHSEKLYSTTQVAKELQMSAQELNQFLHAYGVIYRSNGQWVLYESVKKQAATKNKVLTQSTTNMSPAGQVYTYTKWTEDGRNFVHNYFIDTINRVAKQTTEEGII